MKKFMVAASLVVLLGGAAVAQTGTKGATSGGATSGTLPQAPVGHRQPRAGDVPSEKSLNDPNNPVNKEDALLDKKIKSICRGC
ncbi:hypothetical protein KUL72_20170 [Bradyrhizobium arachidis]|uniref:hypothetical protein n=1 Tax=Bradyrhizobium TaxID=374 RepID=UPI00188C3F63|nr:MULTISPECIES: hypothetical protein [Bradyrhizobium]MDN4982394.1 hypothetical protein [Bradyrhizobium sp. WYCCWR 13022]QOZ53395.1 hypothetical protein XH90_19985 [Bradyrhizobium sp. CCBAU 53338]UVO33837.1 hypothetical protein KUL72_20170 [Bradyrhizobium arachidis]